ncbi:MAG: class I SAM-dependent methyltransferase [Defluviitaleaceae bacterium]|nr:class I SAM-dependent methyltransferase [Defluviitaleaceae bacterium]
MSAEFDKLANSYDDWHNNLIKGSGFSREYFLEYKVKEVSRVLSDVAPLRILDFGCGVGDVIPYLQKYFPSARICGADISAESINTARERYPAISFVSFENGATPPSQMDNLFGGVIEQALARFETDFDLVFIAGVFHHAPPEQHFEILSAIKKYMATGAKIFIFELNPLNPATRYVFNKYEKPIDKNANLIKPGYLQGLLREVGFVISGRVYRIFFPYFLRGLVPFERCLGGVPFGAHYYLWGRV